MWVYQRRLYFVKLLICALEVLRPVLLTSNITQTRACFRTFQNNGAFQWWINPKKANLLSFAMKKRQIQCMSGAFTNSTWKMRNWNFQGTDWEEGGWTQVQDVHTFSVTRRRRGWRLTGLHFWHFGHFVSNKEIEPHEPNKTKTCISTLLTGNDCLTCISS